MLARSSAMPAKAGYGYEPKLDGFRCLIRTEGRYRAMSRRRWGASRRTEELMATSRFRLATCDT
jgi:ATP-dependent DNA ligase